MCAVAFAYGLFTGECLPPADGEIDKSRFDLERQTDPIARLGGYPNAPPALSSVFSAMYSRWSPAGAVSTYDLQPQAVIVRGVRIYWPIRPNSSRLFPAEGGRSVRR